MCTCRGGRASESGVGAEALWVYVEESIERAVTINGYEALRLTA